MFLKGGEWQDVLESCISDSPLQKNLHESFISLTKIIASSSGLVADCAALIVKDRNSPHRRSRLLTRVDRHRSELIHWRRQWGQYTFSPMRPDGEALEKMDPGEGDMPGRQIHNWCTSECYMLLTNLLRTCLGRQLASASQRQSHEITASMVGDEPRGSGIAHSVRGNATQVILLNISLAVATVTLEPLPLFQALAERGDKSR